MAASRASSGGNALSSQFDNHADYIDMLVAAVINTGGTVGAATLAANTGWKEESVVIPSGSTSGGVTITHGLGWTPSVVFTQLRGNPNSGDALYNIHHVSNITGTTFIVYFGNTFSAGSWTPASPLQPITFDWRAEK